METPEQQRRSVIGQFAKTLAAAKLDCDPIDLADMLWLAQFIEPGAVPQRDNQSKEQRTPLPAIEIDNSSLDKGLDLYPDPRQTASNVSNQQPQAVAETEQKKQSQGTPFSVPAAPALRTRLDLARSLRPLMRRVRSRTHFELDEDATVTQIAETKVWMPMLKPRSERWLELDLVVESSKTTAIWERAIAELNHLVEYQGAFRSIRTWRLQETAGKIQLFPRWRDDSLQSPDPTASPQTQRPHTPGELIDPTGRRLIWLVTDCTSLLWRQEPLYQTLLEWSKIQPIAIVQMFPERLWSRTALRDGHIVKLSALEPGVPSARLEVEDLPQRLARVSSKELVTVPIVTIEAASMKSWARVTSGYGDICTPGRTFELSFIRKQAATPRAGRERTSQRTARERVALFRSTASQTAQQLADLMAAAPVSLPAIDLLRDAFRGDFAAEIQQSHVAEVLLSGLLQRCDTAADKVCHYQFFGDDSSHPHERVRDLLLGDASISKTVTVLNVLSASIGPKLFGSPIKTFQALLNNLQTAASDRRDAALPFARVGLDVLRRLGGEYAALARRYDRSSASGDGKQSNSEFPPPLIDLEYEVAKLIEFPALQTCEYESATITAILDRVDFETAQVKRENRLLGLGSEWKIDRRQATTWGYTEILTSDSKAEIGLDMVAISGGSFLMGAPTSESGSRDRERPQHQVTLQPFYLGRYPITQAQWQEVATYPKIDRDLKSAPSTFTGDNLPVEKVSWDNAQEFCQRLSAKTGNNYCLPSEAQWEYACRAGSTTPFHYGETITPKLANYYTDKSYQGSPTTKNRGRTTEVGSFPANEWGLHDMHGNVWEWCEDDWHDNYHGAPTDGIAWVKSDRSNTTKLLRGGSWVNIPRNCRAAIRYDDTREYINYNVGFRVCCMPSVT